MGLFLREAQGRPAVPEVRADQAAWRLGVSIGEYRELEAGAPSPTVRDVERICKLYE